MTIKLHVFPLSPRGFKVLNHVRLIQGDGINDEVILRGSKSKKSYPGAPGIMPQAEFAERPLPLETSTRDE